MLLKIEKYLTEYLSSRVVYVMDVAISFVCSFVVLLLLNFFTASDYYRTAFAIWWLGSAFVASGLAIYIFKSYRAIIRRLSVRDLGRFFVAIVVKDLLMLVVLAVAGLVTKSVLVALGIDFLITVFALVVVRILMIFAYDIYRSKVKDMQNRKRVLVFSTGEKSAAVEARLQGSPHYEVVGYVTRNATGKQLTIRGHKVNFFTTEKEFGDILDKYSANALLFATEEGARQEPGLITYCNKNNVKVLIVPAIDEMTGKQYFTDRIREVKIEDLLGRTEIKISMDAISAMFKGKCVLVTGAAGSIGSELCRQLAFLGVSKLVLFDNAETPMHNIRLELESRFPELDFTPVIGDVRQPQRIDFAFRKFRPQVVFHAAAYKHVPLMETNPCEAVLVNVNGTRNVADKCIEYGVEKMVMISTDKAVNPTNIMGCSKRLAEIYVQSLGLAIERGTREGKTRFVTTRFGNVLGSNGSVIPRFRDQIAAGGPVTVTHPDITRFFMTIPEACRLVMEAATMSKGNQIFVFDMGESVKIDTLARKMIELSGLRPDVDIKIEYTGLRPGEKLYEEVLSNTENTDPTPHEKIRVARVREYEYNEVVPIVDELTDLSRKVEIPEMVMLMKKTVPEFKSKNSEYSKYDK
ncbi:MAG: polysaccharide biosynthesis protein [Bacteroidales bacterium]|nr:polysaccharide biosynthesis protein [Bacteroidales bacterium]